MNHDYGSYVIPAPVIKDVTASLRDAIGDLTTTYALMTALIGDIEGVQDLVNSQGRPGSRVSPDAVEQRLAALWSLAEAIDARLKDGIILLGAIEGHELKNEVVKKGTALERLNA